MDDFLEIRQEIERLAENDYKKFSANLLPGVEHVLGVRLPQLRQIAKEVAQGNWQQYLLEEPYYFEELMLQGMVIGAIKVEPKERLRYIAAFVPRINSWSVCDSFCSGLKSKISSLCGSFYSLIYIVARSIKSVLLLL